MKKPGLRCIEALALISICMCLVGCGVTGSAHSSGIPALAITTGSFSAINAGSTAVSLMVNQFVNWSLTQANQPCSPGCGTLAAKSGSNTATYTPPASAPVYGRASIILTSPVDNTVQYILPFTIYGPLQVSITSASKFTSVVAGSAPVPVTATISNDISSGGIVWTLAAGGANCAPGCGTLSNASSLTATYTPPAVAPAGAAANPTLTAAAAANPQVTDSFSFNILPAILVTITSPKFASVQFGSGPISIAASITNDTQSNGLSWSLTAGGSACSPACGALTFSASPSLMATYTPPATLPTGAAAAPTITVSSVTNPLANDSISFFIIGAISVTITSPKFNTVFANGAPINMTATISNDNTGKGVAWTLTAGGSACSPACGTITFSTTPNGSGAYTASYTPPQSVPTGDADNPTIAANSAVNPSASDSFSFGILSASNLFKGSYAFLMRGYDTSGNPVCMAGSLASDGQGNITAGELDINDDGGTLHVPGPLTGSYTTDATGTLGVITISTTSFVFPGSSTGVGFRFTLSSDGTRGRIIETDGSGFREAGAFLKQDPAALTAANPAGAYAFGLDADASMGGSTRTVEIGQFTMGATGDVTSGVMDLGKAEALTPVLTDQSFNSSVGTAPDTLGRGQMSLSVTVAAVSQTYSAQYAYYVVNASQMFIIEVDSGWQYATAQAGTARLQQGLGSPNDVNGTTVLQLTGIDVSSGQAPYTEPLNVLGPHVLIGQMVISGGNSLSMTFDSNDLGVVSTQLTIPSTTQGSVPGVVSYDPTTGRGTITISFGYDQGFVNSAVFYLYAPSSGFLIDADPSPNSQPPALTLTNQGYSGTFVPQQPNPDTISFSGNMIAYTGASSTPGFNIAATLMGAPPIPDVPVMEGLVAVNGATGAANYLVQLSSITSGNFLDLSLPGNFGGVPDPTGHATEIVPQVFTGDTTASGYNQIFAAIYAIAPNQCVLIVKQGGRMSGVMFFDPQ